jgi:hypothetical protein
MLDQKRLRRACGRALSARLIRSHNCAAVFGLRLCRNWALWSRHQKIPNLALRGLYQRVPNLAPAGRLKADIRRPCGPASE